jgi:pimeloyl-ACP methyl ester carboxylesterase
MTDTDSADSPPAQAPQGPGQTGRTVFYIAGFDPRGPVHYHHLYASEGAKQAAVNGLVLDVSKRRNVDEVESEWTVTAKGVSTHYRYLRYEDIVRRQWPRNAFQTYGGIIRYSWHFLRMGVFAMIARNSWPGFIAVAYPAALLGAMFILALLLGLAAAAFLATLLGKFSWIAVPAALALPFLAYRPIEKWLNAFWLARSCIFLVDRSLGRVPGIEERCLVFARRIAQAVNRDGGGEVLLVGHSVGAHLAVTVAARVLEQLGQNQSFSMLTLGQAIAMTPDEPQAAQFREDLLRISTSGQIDWIDVTSAVDGSCIALTDPLAASNVHRPEGARVQPKLVSARFNAQFTPETYRTIRRNFMRTHFQYLMAAEIPGDYDYFLITAGPLTLAERFAHLDSVTTFNRFRLGQA